MLEANKIYQGDCLEVMKQIEDRSIDMVLTDIPYGEVSKNGEKREKHKGQLRKINKYNADVITFNMEDLLKQLDRILKGSIYIFCGIEQVGFIYMFFKNNSDFMVRHCIWRKTNPAPINGQHLWLSSFENCIFAKRRKTKFNQLCKSSIWDFQVGKSKIHPTEKPINLFEYLIKSSSDENDLILDCFAGSGTTGVACQNLKRNYILIEKDEKYFQLAKDRLEKNLDGRLF